MDKLQIKIPVNLDLSELGDLKKIVEKLNKDTRLDVGVDASNVNKQFEQIGKKIKSVQGTSIEFFSQLKKEQVTAGNIADVLSKKYGNLQIKSKSLNETTGEAVVVLRKNSKENIILKTHLDNTSGALTEISRTTKDATRDNMGLVASFTEGLKKTVVWATAMTAFYGTLRQIQSGIKSLVELDKSLTNVAIVTGWNKEQIKDIGLEYNNLAKALGQTTKAVIDSSDEYYRQGKTHAQTLELVKATTIGASIANIDLAQTSEYLTSTLNGMGLQANDAMMVVDKYAKVGAVAGTSFEVTIANYLPYS